MPHRDTLYSAGIAGLPGALPPSWADDLDADFRVAFDAARSIPGGTAPRGPNRHYLAVHPEHVGHFVDLLTHPTITSVCTAVLGPDYQVIELGYDVPLPGAVDQPWHRDFPTPPATAQERRLTSLAFNIPTVDVRDGMAPFEVVPGTHWDNGADFEHGMFPTAAAAERYGARGLLRHPRRGDVSVRSGLTIHRGTANRTSRARAVLILGVVDAELALEPQSVHDLNVTRAYYESLPGSVAAHLRCTVVDTLRPIVQRHDIEGLLMGG